MSTSTEFNAAEAAAVTATNVSVVSSLGVPIFSHEEPYCIVAATKLTNATKFSFDFVAPLTSSAAVITTTAATTEFISSQAVSQLPTSLAVSRHVTKAKNSLRSLPPPPLLLVPSAHSTISFYGRPSLGTPPLDEVVETGAKIENSLLIPSAEAQLIKTSTSIAPIGQITFPKHSCASSFKPVVESVKLDADQCIISQASAVSQHQSQVGDIKIAADFVAPNMLKTPPLICEQGPSAPSSPTSFGGGRLSLKKPSPLSVDALQRFDLLSPNYVPSMDYTKLTPVSPGYSTSDLGSSPRSSISIARNSASWQMFCDSRKHHSNSSDYGDGDSDIYGKSDFLTPGQLLSPAPFSPLSDYGASNSSTPNLSPFPNNTNSLYFSFDQVRSRSAMSNWNRMGGTAAFGGSKSPCRRRQYHNNDRHSPINHRSLGSDYKERSCSEGEMLKKTPGDDYDEDAEDEDDMDTSTNHSILSVPLNKLSSSGASYKKHRKMALHASESIPDSATSQREFAANSLIFFGQSPDEKINDNEKVLRQQPTIEEPPPSPTFVELFHSRNLDQERQNQVEEWIRQQASALETFRNSLVPLRQEANLLQVPKNTHVPQPSMEQLCQIFGQKSKQSGPPGPLRPATLWRRSRSESDVSVPINDAAYICEHCGQGFAMHDRLTKHIASRHRDRSASVNDEKNKIHKCKLCPKSFGRSDMLTRHMRLHTGVKPYSCQICGQVFSRSDHLSTHQRTHTGEKPYRCPHCSYAASRRDMITRHMRTHLRPDGTPLGLNELQIPIAQLSLNQQTPELPMTLGMGDPTTAVRSVSPALLHYRHQPSMCASPNCVSLNFKDTTQHLSLCGESQSILSPCSSPALAMTTLHLQHPIVLDSEDIDVEASSSSEEMELDKVIIKKSCSAAELPKPTSIPSSFSNTSTASVDCVEAPFLHPPFIEPSDKTQHAEDLLSISLNSFSSAETLSSPLNQPLLSAIEVDEFSRFSAFLRQQTLPTKLTTSPSPSLISLVSPKTILPQLLEQPQNHQHQQQPVSEFVSAADSIAAKVLAAMAVATDFSCSNIIENNEPAVPNTVDATILVSQLTSSLNANSTTSASKFFTTQDHTSAFHPLTRLNTPPKVDAVSVASSLFTVNTTTSLLTPSTGTQDVTTTSSGANAGVDMLRLILLNTNPQLLASLQQHQQQSNFLAQQLPTTSAPPPQPATVKSDATATYPSPSSAGSTLSSLVALFRQNSIGGLGFDGTTKTNVAPFFAPQSTQR